MTQLDIETLVCDECMRAAKCKRYSYVITYETRGMTCFNCGSYHDTIQLKYVIPEEQSDDYF